MKIGVMVGLTETVEREIERAAGMGMECCQIVTWNPALQTQAMAARCREACDRFGVEPTTAWIGWSGPAVWDFIDGPGTLGLVPPEYRETRVEELRHGAEFAAWLGVPQIATHMGFLPENPGDPLYPPVVEAIRRVAERCRELGLLLLFETGQETPTTLKRLFDDVGTGNLGVNLDPANLLLYGKANPVDALKILGPYVGDVHAKDGEYPTEGRHLGEEKPLGQGSVHFPELIRALRAHGYDKSLVIEREISGERQARDIRMARDLLREMLRA